MKKKKYIVTIRLGDFKIRLYTKEEMEKLLYKNPEKLVGKIIIDKWDRIFICEKVDVKKKQLIGRQLILKPRVAM